MPDFAFSDEQEQLRATVRQFLADKSSESEVRRLMETDSGYDAVTWSLMAEQLGLQGLAIPEEYGGSGFGWLELGVVFEEMGRALACAPYLATAALAAPALLASGDAAAQKDYLPGIAAGTTIGTLAWTEGEGRWDLQGITTTATETGDGWALTGAKSYVIDGHVADLVLAVARTPRGLSLFAVDAGAAGLSRRRLATLDETRRLARVEFADTPARLVGADGDAAAVVEHVADLAAVALALEQVGGAQRVLDMAVEHAKNRFQFGRPIGSFQAVKHKCADLLIGVESARSAAYAAVWSAAEDRADLPEVASLAKAFCSEAYVAAAAENIQIHGGIGFTWEHPAHLYFKRAKSTALLFGDPTYHRELMAQRVAW